MRKRGLCARYTGLRRTIPSVWVLQQPASDPKKEGVTGRKTHKISARSMDIKRRTGCQKYKQSRQVVREMECKRGRHLQQGDVKTGLGHDGGLIGWSYWGEL